MIQKPVSRNSWLTVLLIAAAVVLWAIDQKRGIQNHNTPDKPKIEKAPPASEPPSKAPPTKSPSAKTAEQAPTRPANGRPEKKGAYEVYRGCTLAEHHSNDGDSFLVRLPDGRTETFRLYYVDTPESAFRSYAGGDTNHERIRQQAAEMGGITPQQAVDIGKQGKVFTLGLLGASPFTIYTCWDSPYNDQRYHAFVEIMENGKPRWLHEMLVERGLVRMKTKPADLPDGTPVSRYREQLREMERRAKQAGTGVWGL